jgi:hypothetical protein
MKLRPREWSNSTPSRVQSILLVGVYAPTTIYENENTAVKFSSDGTLEFASGTQGKLEAFRRHRSHFHSLHF